MHDIKSLMFDSFGMVLNLKRTSIEKYYKQLQKFTFLQRIDIFIVPT